MGKSINAIRPSFWSIILRPEVKAMRLLNSRKMKATNIPIEATQYCPLIEAVRPVALASFGRTFSEIFSKRVKTS